MMSERIGQQLLPLPIFAMVTLVACLFWITPAAHAQMGPEASPSSFAPKWGRPWVMLKVAAGMPDLLSGRIEAYIPFTPVTLEAGYSVQGLQGNVLSTSVKWRPGATCWGCDTRNLFSMGFGVEANVIFASPTKLGILLAPTIDVQYVHRFFEHFGVLFGLQGGLGLGWEVDTPPSTKDSLAPSFFARVYLGFAI